MATSTQDPAKQVIKFVCPYCGGVNRASATEFGTRKRCLGCSNGVRVPYPQTRRVPPKPAVRVASERASHVCPFLCSESVLHPERKCKHTSPSMRMSAQGVALTGGLRRMLVAVVLLAVATVGVCCYVLLSQLGA